MACNDSSPETTTQKEDVFYAMAYVLVSLLTFTANLFTILTFALNRSLRKRAVYCVIHLAVADMLAGLGLAVSGLLVLGIHGVSGVVNRRIFTCLNQLILIQSIIHVVFINMTICSIALVAVERMIAILWPVYHRRTSIYLIPSFITITWVVIIANSIYCALCFTVIHNGFIFYAYFAIIAICGILIIIALCYISILIKVNTQTIATVNKSSRRDSGLALTLFIVTVASLGAWLPLGLLYVLRVFTSVHVSPIVHLNLLALGESNSLLNPIIYVYRMKDFRRALYALCRCSLYRQTRAIVPVSIPVANSSNRASGL